MSRKTELGGFAIDKMEKSTKVIILILIVIGLLSIFFVSFSVKKNNCYQSLAEDFCEDKGWRGKTIANFLDVNGYYIECYEDERSVYPIKEFKFTEEEKGNC